MSNSNIDTTETIPETGEAYYLVDMCRATPDVVAFIYSRSECVTVVQKSLMMSRVIAQRFEDVARLLCRQSLIRSRGDHKEISNNVDALWPQYLSDAATILALTQLPDRLDYTDREDWIDQVLAALNDGGTLGPEYRRDRLRTLHNHAFNQGATYVRPKHTRRREGDLPKCLICGGPVIEVCDPCTAKEAARNGSTLLASQADDTIERCAQRLLYHKSRSSDATARKWLQSLVDDLRTLKTTSPHIVEKQV
jgi:hypothetical protein